MKGLTLSTALLAALLASSAFAASEEIDDQKAAMKDAEPGMTQQDQQWNEEKEEYHENKDKTMGHDGMEGMESKAEQKRRELEKKADHDMLPNTGTDAGYEGGTDTSEPTN